MAYAYNLDTQMAIAGRITSLSYVVSSRPVRSTEDHLREKERRGTEEKSRQQVGRERKKEENTIPFSERHFIWVAYEQSQL